VKPKSRKKNVVASGTRQSDQIAAHFSGALMTIEGIPGSFLNLDLIYKGILLLRHS